jgi:hypothetical protein
MAKKPTEGRRKLVEFDAQTWHALNLLSREAMKTFQELADEAFRDLLQKGGVPGFDPPQFSCQISRRQSGQPTGNELSYAFAKATEATTPEAAEASTAAPSRRIGGTRFSVNERVAKKPRLSGASVALRPTRRSAPGRTTTMPALGAPVIRFFSRNTNRPGGHRDSQHSSAGLTVEVS